MEFEIFRYFGALAFVLALVGAAGIAMKKFGGHALPGKNRRLSVVESLGMGPRHRLYLVRCDNVEHLVVLGPQGATPLSPTDTPQKFRLQEVGT